MTEKLTVKFSPAAEDFFRARFGSVRWGITYTLEALPQLVDRTRHEIYQKISDNIVAKAMAALSWSEADIRFDGNRIVASAPAKVRPHMEKLPVFARAVLEIDAFREAGCRVPDQARQGSYVPIQITSEAFSFLRELGIPRIAAPFLLEFFAYWVNETVNCLPQSLVSQAAEALTYDTLETPLLAGQLLPMRYRTLCQLGLADDTAVAGLPVFAAAALEIHSMRRTSQGKQVYASPKLSAPVGEGLISLFGNANAGAQFALAIFPRVFRQTLAEEVLPRFRRQDDLEILDKLLAQHELGVPETVGDLVLLTVGDVPKDLGDRIQQLSPFGRICLEQLIALRRKGGKAF